MHQIPIHPTNRAQTLTLSPADHLHRHRENDLLCGHVRRVDSVPRVKAGFQLILGDFHLFFLGNRLHRLVEEVKITTDGELDGPQAAVTTGFEAGV